MRHGGRVPCCFCSLTSASREKEEREETEGHSHQEGDGLRFPHWVDGIKVIPPLHSASLLPAVLTMARNRLSKRPLLMQENVFPKGAAVGIMIFLVSKYKDKFTKWGRG